MQSMKHVSRFVRAVVGVIGVVFLGLAPGVATAMAVEVETLNRAFRSGDGAAVVATLAGRDAEDLEALKERYFNRYGRDLEYDMHGWALTKPVLDLRGFAPTGRGLKGAALTAGLRALHGPRVRDNAARIATLTAAGAPTRAERAEVYRMLAYAGGFERALLAEVFAEATGGDLVETLRPLLAEAAVANGERPVSSPAETTVAVVVSTGNWSQRVDGQHSEPVGGYHWREVEAYVAEALARGYTPVVFTHRGLPPSPDAASLLRGKFGPLVGFGLRPGTGIASPQGRAIDRGFAEPRPLASLDPAAFATVHVAGGHGSHYDLVGNPEVERVAMAIHTQGRIVTAVCHATPSLGRLLEGGPATGFSPQIDAAMVKAGYVLPEFVPPYDAHQGLVEIGVNVTLIDRFQALVNIHHTERFVRSNGVPVVTGTGPEATDDVARIAFDWLDARVF